jgi:hypothetical protein
MNRQLRADGGIMEVAPREKFGLGSSIKKFVRKIIPNEVSEIAVKAAPFVAPFNPLLAAGMSGLGSFDQTGRIGDSLKSGALTYGLGQGARYLGGADFQQGINPFSGMDGMKYGFSKPTGSGGIKNLFKNNTTQAIQPVGGGDQIGTYTEGLTGGTPLPSEVSYVAPGTVSGNTTGSSNFSNFVDYGKDLLKKGAKAAFYDSEGKLDRAAVIGAATAAVSYAEALALAKDAGVELTEEEYDQAQADEKREEYGEYLQNFFGGKKDGGRIGFESGANEMIKEKLMMELGLYPSPEEESSGIGLYPSPITEEDSEIIMTKDGPVSIKEIFERDTPLSEDLLGMSDGFTLSPVTLLRRYLANKELENKANGGRIGYADGPRTTRVGNLEIIVMPGSSQEKAVVDGLMNDIDGIVDEDTKMDFYRTLIPELIYSGEIQSQEGMKLLQELGINMKADGGRIGFKFGTKPEEAEIGIMSIDVEAGDDDDMEDMDMAMAFPTTVFSSSEISRLFRDRSLTTNIDRKRLFKVLMNPGMFPEGEKMLIRNLRGQADGGRIGYKGGANRVSELLILRDNLLANGEDVSDIEAEIFQITGKTLKSIGGISNIPTGKMRKNNAGVVERDYRDEGGFVPVGIKERADDVPAMLSKNEFVMTADAVRGIGNGSVEEGSKKLYNTMKQAEKVGKA